MSEWQPIETAPKDGSAVLLWGRCGLRLAFWNGRSWDDGDYFTDLKASYWAPVPAPLPNIPNPPSAAGGE